jgi:long-subunit acyl-CoA synthetase (AMP-forming)
MFKEYLNKPEATAEVLDTGGWYYPSDLASRDDQSKTRLQEEKKGFHY